MTRWLLAAVLVLLAAPVWAQTLDRDQRDAFAMFDMDGDGQLSREDLSTPLPADDLVMRAARALQTASGTSQGAHIAITKTIPAQAGMGVARLTRPVPCWHSTGCGA